MKTCKMMMTLGAMCVFGMSMPGAFSQDKSTATAATAEVHVVITDAKLRNDQELPPLQKEDVKVKQGKKFLDITQLIPAQGQNDAECRQQPQ